MNNNLRIALAQINPIVGDLEYNSKKIIYFIQQAKKRKADIVTFPELALCGYPPEDLVLKEHFIKQNLKVLDSIIKNVFGIIVIVGFVDRDKNGDIYNAAAVIQNGKLKGIYCKTDLPNYSVFDEKRYFKSGSNSLIFMAGDIKFGVNICEDIWRKDGVVKEQARRGAKLIINISSSPYYAGKIIIRKNVLIERAKDTGAYICYNNLVGGQDELVFDGASMVIDNKGKVKARASQFQEELLLVDLPIKDICALKTNSDSGLFIQLDELEKSKKPALESKIYKELGKIEEIYNALVLGTRDYILKNGFKKVVIGLSGGIDSSLTAMIACDAIGKKNVVGISMPSLFSSKATQKDAEALAKNLGIKFFKVPISDIFTAYLDIFSRNFKLSQNDITKENIQARIRGNILMAFSNKFGWLVLTTGNKSEVSVGYCTLYGDMAGGFAVIKDVPKTLVYKLSEFRDKENKIIPKSVFDRAPSAELRKDQTDQDTLPEYPVLDSIIKEYVEEDKSFEEIVVETRQCRVSTNIIKDVIRKIDTNEYKRRQAPPGIKITPKAFGKDRRLPITNRFREF